jgi:hypothetical protein
MFYGKKGYLLAMALVAGMCGCVQKAANGPQSAAGVPLGLQMVRTEAQMKKYPFRTLQQFELPVDLAFLTADGAAAKLDSSRAHTGASSVAMAAGTKGAVVKLPSLLSGVSWPGQWTLAGAYFYANQPQRMTAVYELEGKVLLTYSLELPAAAWTPVLMDIASIEGPAAGIVGTIRYTFPGGLAQTVWCDDVILLNNSEEHVAQPAKGQAPWSISERGFAYTIERPGMFKVKLKTPEASDQGWMLKEANELRAVFTSKGKEKSYVIYADGRAIVDGQMRAMSVPPDVAASLAQQHQNPGVITIAEELGRVQRNHPGDANNDGYAETMGTYELLATGGRLEFAIAPREGDGLTRPVVEIAGLPAGNLLVNMEGRLVQDVVRLEDGHVLIALPGMIRSKMTVSVRVGGR